MTKVIILGEATPEQTKKPIEFVYTLATADYTIINEIRFETCGSRPSHWEEITLLYRNYFRGFDLFFCTDRRNGNDMRAIILGHFNDGIIAE